MESIGSRLRSARESKGITLDQAQRDTRISSRILSALESDRIAEIVSGPVYIKSFIKKYANYLGLNGTDLAEGFTGEKPGFKDQISILAKDNSPGQFPVKKIILWIVAAVVLVLAVKLAVLAVSKTAAFFRSRPEVAKKEPAAAAAKPAPKQEKAVERPVVNIPKYDVLVLTVKSRADVYLKIKSDGRLIFEGTLKKGLEEKWEARNSFELSTSKAEYLTLDLNGTSLGSLGKGVVKGLKLPK